MTLSQSLLVAPLPPPHGRPNGVTRMATNQMAGPRITLKCERDIMDKVSYSGPRCHFMQYCKGMINLVEALIP